MILALIQARMDSTRLPGKVLLPILGKPVLWYIYNLLKFSKKINEICISTSSHLKYEREKKHRSKVNPNDNLFLNTNKTVF